MAVSYIPTGIIRHVYVRLHSVDKVIRLSTTPIRYIQSSAGSNCNVQSLCKQPGCRPHCKLNAQLQIVPNHHRMMSYLVGKDKDFILRQFLEYKSFTYTYLLADPDSKDAVIIDPVYETVSRDIKLIKDMGLILKYAVNTHVHADHITGTGEIKKQIPTCQSMISAYSGATADIKLKDGDKIEFGKYQIEVRATPGHTNGCVTYVWHEKKMAFTGDTLLIRGCGRTDFQEGSSDKLYESVHTKIFTLPEDYTVYPAHDYTGQTSSTVGEEKNFNPRLTKPKDQFVKIMKELNLPYPKQIDKALPANMVCGLYNLPTETNTT